MTATVPAGSARGARVVVDGVEYVPAGERGAPRIGVGITTHNRRETFLETHRRIVEMTPEAKVVVVDDASTEPVEGASFRFEEQAGIARAKNKCLELLQECEHIFLFDDDCYPLVEGWWRPYVESPEPHLMRIFEDLAGARKLRDISCVYRDSRHEAWTRPRGMMLYVDRRVLDVVGGMDPGFGLWGWEHGDWSNRIHAAGLTSWRYADVVGGGELIYSLDEHELVERSVDRQVRDEHTRSNVGRFHEQMNAARYCEFRESRDVVLTCLFSGQPDPQRGRSMRPDPGLLAALLGSLRGHRAVVLHDGLDAPSDDGLVVWERVETADNPYFQRWLAYWQWLRAHPEVRWVWCVDGTDVEMLHDPFPTMEPGRLYLGCETATVAHPWVRDNHPAGLVQGFIDADPGRQLLNAGLVGGDRRTVMGFLHDLVRARFDNATDVFHGKDVELGTTDMGAFNVVAWTGWADRLVFGPRVNTVFKAEERNGWSWWKHK